MSTKKLGRQTPTKSVVLPYTHSEGAQAVAGAASAPDISEEKMVRRMTSTTENITRSFYDDYVETNVCSFPSKTQKPYTQNTKKR